MPVPIVLMFQYMFLIIGAWCRFKYCRSNDCLFGSQNCRFKYFQFQFQFQILPFKWLHFWQSKLPFQLQFQFLILPFKWLPFWQSKLPFQISTIVSQHKKKIASSHCTDVSIHVFDNWCMVHGERCMYVYIFIYI